MCNSWRQTEIQTFRSDLVFGCGAWCGAGVPPGRSSSSADFRDLFQQQSHPGTHSQHAEQPRAVPAGELTLKILLCVAWPMPRWNIAPLVTSKQSSEKPNSALEKAKHTNRGKQHIQSSWNGQWRGGSWMLFGEIPHTSWRTNPLVFWFFLPLSGEAHAKTRQFLNKATERQMCQARTSCFKPGDWF